MNWAAPVSIFVLPANELMFLCAQGALNPPSWWGQAVFIVYVGLDWAY
jgi:hypothetical protein